MTKILLPTLILGSLFFASCTSDEDNNPITVDPVDVNAPATYTFERDGSSTVSFDGQTTRILMATEILSKFTDFDNSTEVSIQNMFAHVEGANDFSNADLNASNKNVRSKVAASQDYFSTNATGSAQIKTTFDGFISSQINEVFPNRNTVAEPGVAGQIADGTKTRYVNTKGLEYNQAFAKGLLGALMTDQVLNNYLSEAVLDEADNRETNNNDVPEVNANFTTMEHKWDEAYGYVYGLSANAATPNVTIGEDDKFLNEYIGRVNEDADFNTIAKDIFEAFKLGRAAIVANNYEVRDAQAEIIRAKISEVIAIRGIYYLQQAKAKIEDGNQTEAFHALSEAYGFVYSLQFTRKPTTNSPYLSGTEVNNLTSQLLNDGANGFWTLTPATIDAVSESIAAKFSFTVVQAASLD